MCVRVFVLCIRRKLPSIPSIPSVCIHAIEMPEVGIAVISTYLRIIIAWTLNELPYYVVRMYTYGRTNKRTHGGQQWP